MFPLHDFVVVHITTRHFADAGECHRERRYRRKCTRKMQESTESERQILRLLDGVRPLVERRLARLTRDQREDAVLAVMSEVYLKLQPDATAGDVHDLAIYELRLIERYEKWDLRHRALSYDAERSIIDPAIEAKREYRLRLWVYLEGVLSHLSETERLVIEAFHADSRSDAETAALLGWSLEKVRKVRSRAKRKLRGLVASRAVAPPQL